MSKTKAVHVVDRMAWTWDNSHDAVLAHLVEAAIESGYNNEPFLEDWRVWASIPDLAFDYPTPTAPDSVAMAELLDEVRIRVSAQGDLTLVDFQSWSVLSGEPVSAGFLRTPSLPVRALNDVINGFSDMIAGTFPPDPPDAAWLLGHPDGRGQIPMRQR